MRSLEKIEKKSKKLDRVLLVDDNEFTNIFNTRLLKKSGVSEEIASVLNGREALNYLCDSDKDSNLKGASLKPDLILLDLNMPVMDGWEFLEEFKELVQKGNDLMNCKVVVLTTSPNKDDEIRAKSIFNIADYRLKPISESMIHDILEGIE